MDVEVQEAEGLDLLDASGGPVDEEVALSNFHYAYYFVALGSHIETIVGAEKFSASCDYLG